MSEQHNTADYYCQERTHDGGEESWWNVRCLICRPFPPPSKTNDEKDKE